MWIARGIQKPPLGARVNPAHPLAKDLLLVIPFNEGSGQVGDSTASGPIILTGLTRAGTIAPPKTMTATLSGGIPWGSNRDGICSAMQSSGAVWQIGTDGNWLPLSATTVCIVRRKRDTTNRSAALFGASSTAANRLGAQVPWNDGVVSWDFGGFSGANRLSASGLSFSTTIPERWIFTAGPSGSTIWQNGIKVASQSTAITRTGATDALNLNAGNGSSTPDVVDINYFAIYNTQWSDELCKWWSASPYEHLYSEQARTFTFLASGGISSQITFTAPAPSFLISEDVATINSSSSPPGAIGVIHRCLRLH